MPELTESTQTDSSIIAASMPEDTAASSAAQAAEESAASQDTTAASPDDEIARLKSDHKDAMKNILAPKEDEQAEAETEQPEQIAQEETEEPEAVEADSLAPEGPRTLEALKAQFPRAQTVALEEIARVDKLAWDTQEKLNALGGEIGIGIANEVMPLILKADITPEDGDKFAESVFITNPMLGIEMSKILLDKAFAEDEIDTESGLPIRVATANAMIQKHLDPDYTLDKIEALIKFDKAGLIDHEELQKDLEMEGESETVKALKSQIAELKGVQDKDKADKERAAQIETQKHYRKATDSVSQKAMDSLIPIAEQYGWTATKEELASDKPDVKELAEAKVKMGELLTAWMEQRKTQYPEWASIDHLAKNQNAFNDDGNPTSIFTVNSTTLCNRIVADFKEMLRVLNKTFAKSLGSSRAAVKAKTVQKRPVEEIPQTKKVEEKASDDDTIATLRRQYREEMSQVRAQAG